MMTFLGRHVLPAHLAKQGSLIASWLNRCLREEHYLNYHAFRLMAVRVYVCVCHVSCVMSPVSQLAAAISVPLWQVLLVRVCVCVCVCVSLCVTTLQLVAAVLFA